MARFDRKQWHSQTEIANYDLDINNPNRKDEVYEYSSSELMEMLDASFEKSHNLLTQIREAIK